MALWTGARATRCPHCGRLDAPVEQGVIERHRRRDWDRERDRGNEICLGEGVLVGAECEHMMDLLPRCWTQQQRVLDASGEAYFTPDLASG